MKCTYFFSKLTIFKRRITKNEKKLVILSFIFNVGCVTSQSITMAALHIFQFYITQIHILFCLFDFVRVCSKTHGLKRACIADSHAFKVSKGAKIRNPHHQAPHLTQNTNWNVTNSTVRHHKREPSDKPFPAGDHKAHRNRRVQRHSKHKTEKTLKIHKRSTALEWSVKYFTGGLKPV